ncbi:MAG: hypothetical protein RL641_919 [Candidatus Parcubacteria bacterium]|jgi:peptidylprolyl isomerase
MKNIILIIVILAAVGGGFWYFSQKTMNIEPDPVTGGKDAADLFTKDTTTTPETLDVNSSVGALTDPNIITNGGDTKKMTSATLRTNKGDITIAFSTTTPNTVANFVKLAQEGFYDGTKFHRVIKGFMNQGGDPLSKDDSKKQMWGTGGPGYKFADEITATNKNDVFTIAMANSGPNTNGSQFFINAAANNFLDTKHTVFGKVTAGMDVVTAINNVKTDATDKPIEPVILQSIVLK